MPVLAVEPRRARELGELVERRNALIVDVGGPDEWAHAPIPGAAGEIPRDRPVILPWRSGNRSTHSRARPRHLVNTP